MTIFEMITSDNENLKIYGRILLEEAIKKQVKENNGKTEKELEADEIIRDILKR